MDTKQLVEKFINGEISETDFDAETSKLTPEEQVALQKEAGIKLPDAVEKLKGVRRGIEKITIEKNTTLETRIQKENLESAKTKFFEEFGIEKLEDQNSFVQNFSTESVNVENILKDMKKHYVATNPEKYLELERKQKAREKEAEDLTAQNAGGGGSGGGGGKINVVSKEVKEYIEAARKKDRIVTPEFAQRALSIAMNKGKIPTQ